MGLFALTLLTTGEGALYTLTGSGVAAFSVTTFGAGDTLLDTAGSTVLDGVLEGVFEGVLTAALTGAALAGVLRTALGAGAGSSFSDSDSSGTSTFCALVGVFLAFAAVGLMSSSSCAGAEMLVLLAAFLVDRGASSAATVSVLDFLAGVLLVGVAARLALLSFSSFAPETFLASFSAQSFARLR